MSSNSSRFIRCALRVVCVCVYVCMRTYCGVCVCGVCVCARICGVCAGMCVYMCLVCVYAGMCACVCIYAFGVYIVFGVSVVCG